MTIDVYHLCLSRYVLGVRTKDPYPQLSESHLQLMNRRIPKKSLQNRQLPRVPQGWFGSLGLVPKLKLNSLRLDDTWEFFWQRKPLQTPSSKKNQDDDRSPVLSRVPTLLLMVQNSGKHQLRLVVYPIILQGFSTIQPVVGWPWDF